jgi:hypothetical protein
MFTLEATTIYSGGLKENPPKPQNSACSVDESFRTNALALHRWTKATLHYRLGAGAKSYLRPNHERTHAHEPIQSWVTSAAGAWSSERDRYLATKEWSSWTQIHPRSRMNTTRTEKGSNSEIISCGLDERHKLYGVLLVGGSIKQASKKVGGAKEKEMLRLGFRGTARTSESLCFAWSGAVEECQAPTAALLQEGRGGGDAAIALALQRNPRPRRSKWFLVALTGRRRSEGRGRAWMEWTALRLRGEKRREESSDGWLMRRKGLCLVVKILVKNYCSIFRCYLVKFIQLWIN